VSPFSHGYRAQGLKRKPKDLSVPYIHKIEVIGKVARGAKTWQLSFYDVDPFFFYNYINGVSHMHNIYIYICEIGDTVENYLINKINIELRRPSARAQETRYDRSLENETKPEIGGGKNGKVNRSSSFFAR
jgi:hypothetical protein